MGTLTNCIKCNNNPCDCGYEYRNWSKQRRIQFAESVLGTGISHIEGSGKSFFVPIVHPLCRDETGTECNCIGTHDLKCKNWKAEY